MNIFVVDQNPKICARVLDDLRLNKMILETGQLLCNGIRHHMGSYITQEEIEEIKPILYKATHENHPCSLWVKRSPGNYVWLAVYFNCLQQERYERTGKDHATYLKLFSIVNKLANSIPTINQAEIKFTFDCSNVFMFKPDNLDPNEFLFIKYRECLVKKWQNDKRTPKWTFRDPPDFYKVAEITDMIRSA